MSNPMDSLYSQIAGADASGGGVYLDAGNYRVRVEKVFFKVSRKGKNLLIVELHILESNAATRPAGSTASWVVNLTDHDSGPGNIKAFIASCLGIPSGDETRMANEITPAVVSNATSEANPLGGLILPVSVIAKPTQTGGTFSLHTWGLSEGVDPNFNNTAPAASPAPQAPAMAAPAVPPAPAPAAPPPAPVAFPPAGWVVHPDSPAHYWNQTTNEVITEAELRAR